MLIVAGKAKFETVEEMEKLLTAGQTMIAETHKEAGCQDYTYSRDITDDRTMRIWELWDDQAALDFHFQTAHMSVFQAALGDAKIAEVSVKIYDVSGVRDLM